MDGGDERKGMEKGLPMRGVVPTLVPSRPDSHTAPDAAEGHALGK